jgi:hypothetical protein
MVEAVVKRNLPLGTSVYKDEWREQVIEAARADLSAAIAAAPASYLLRLVLTEPEIRTILGEEGTDPSLVPQINAQLRAALEASDDR